ncbi:MAG: hypothetical protein Q9165_006412 [Trypethelium subeluteriae]
MGVHHRPKRWKARLIRTIVEDFHDQSSREAYIDQQFQEEREDMKKRLRLYLMVLEALSVTVKNIRVTCALRAMWIGEHLNEFDSEDDHDTFQHMLEVEVYLDKLSREQVADQMWWLENARKPASFSKTQLKEFKWRLIEKLAQNIVIGRFNLTEDDIADFYPGEKEQEELKFYVEDFKREMKYRKRDRKLDTLSHTESSALNSPGSSQQSQVHGARRSTSQSSDKTYSSASPSGMAHGKITQTGQGPSRTGRNPSMAGSTGSSRSSSPSSAIVVTNVAPRASPSGAAAASAAPLSKSSRLTSCPPSETRPGNCAARSSSSGASSRTLDALSSINTHKTQKSSGLSQESMNINNPTPSGSTKGTLAQRRHQGQRTLSAPSGSSSQEKSEGSGQVKKLDKVTQQSQTHGSGGGQRQGTGRSNEWGDSGAA